MDEPAHSTPHGKLTRLGGSMSSRPQKSYNLMEIDKMARKDKRRTPGSGAGITIRIRIRIRKDVEFWDWMEGMGMFVKG